MGGGSSGGSRGGGGGGGGGMEGGGTRGVGLGRGRVGRGSGRGGTGKMWPELPPQPAATSPVAARSPGDTPALPPAPAPTLPPAPARTVAAPGAGDGHLLHLEQPPPPATSHYLPPAPPLTPPPLSPAEEREGQAILAALTRRMQSHEWGRMQQARSKLPAASKAGEVLHKLAGSSVVVVSGETGCGKTTQVPQFILDDAIASGRGAAVNIICTQPRRISAMGVATRVAAERVRSASMPVSFHPCLLTCARASHSSLSQTPSYSPCLRHVSLPRQCEPVGQTVGYQIRLESKRSSATRLLFCTTGVLLRRLHGDKELRGVTHVIVDEVHERSLQSDFLLIILREALRQRPSLRVILMSATINADLFARYFATLGGAGGEGVPATLSVQSGMQSGEAEATDAAAAAGEEEKAAKEEEAGSPPLITLAPTLHIPGFTHPVTEYYLEDVLSLTGHMIEPGSPYAKKAHSAEVGGGAAGLGFSEMVARTANLRRGDGSGKAKGELRGEIEAAVRRVAERGGGGGEEEGDYPEHVYESIEVSGLPSLHLTARCFAALAVAIPRSAVTPTSSHSHLTLPHTPHPSSPHVLPLIPSPHTPGDG